MDSDGTVAAGPIMTGSVTFGDFTVTQAFGTSLRPLLQPPGSSNGSVSAPGSNATTNGDKGLLGVGPYVAVFRMACCLLTSLSFKAIIIASRADSAGL